MNLDKKLPIPDYPSLHEWEDYSATLGVEYMQCIEEGLDIAAYKDLFYAVMTLPKDEVRKKLADVLYEIVMNAPIRADYPYQEPSDLEGILKLRESAPELPAFDADRLPDQVLGAWMGRICGCMLGKSVEGVRTSELHPFLKATGNFPMHRYILKTDLDAVDLTQYKFNFSWPPHADEIDGMPVDDDTNYVVLAQEVIKKYGRDFTPPGYGPCLDGYAAQKRLLHGRTLCLL